MKRYEYRIIKEISKTDLKDYQRKVMNAAKKCNIMKFAMFKGDGFWMLEMHDIVKIEFSCSKKLTNEQINNFRLALDNEFDYGENTMFVMYEEVDH